MKLLYLCHRVPFPPNKGCKVRAYHALRVLSRDHEIHLLTLADKKEDLHHDDALRKVCESVEIFPLPAWPARLRALRALVTGQSMTPAYFASPSMRRRVRELAQSGSFDAVVAYSSSMVPYAQEVPGVPKVIDLVDVDSAKWTDYAKVTQPPKRWVYAAEGRRLRAYEAKLAEVFDAAIVTTHRERELLGEIAGALRSETVRNGIDLEYFQPQGAAKTQHPSLVFTGQMDYFANVDGVVSFVPLFQRMRARYPDLTFTVVGRDPSPEVLALAQEPGIEVTGEVEDVRPYLERSWVFVAPLRIARGVQNKVLEALACRVPVVCSEPVARGVEDGDLVDGEHLLVGRDEAELEAHLDGLLGGSEARERHAREGREAVRRAYSWEGNMGRLGGVLDELAGSEPAAATAP